MGPPGPGSPSARVHSVDYFGHDALVRLVLEESTSGAPIMARVNGDEAPAPGAVVGASVRGPVLTFQHGAGAPTGLESP